MCTPTFSNNYVPQYYNYVPSLCIVKQLPTVLNPNLLSFVCSIPRLLNTYCRIIRIKYVYVLIGEISRIFKKIRQTYFAVFFANSDFVANRTNQRSFLWGITHLFWKKCQHSRSVLHVLISSSVRFRVSRVSTAHSVTLGL